MQARTLRIGAWHIDRLTGEMTKGAETLRLEMRALALLLFLAEHEGKVVSIDEILDRVWSDVTVSPDSVYQAIKTLRRALGDPATIVTVPKLGYKLVAAGAPPVQGSRAWLTVPALLLIALVLVFLSLPGKKGDMRLAVMPFADLTNRMDEEPFADTVAVHLIDAMSRVPGVKVTARSAVFAFKDKADTPQAVARELGVDHLVEGSVHSGQGTLLVTAQLIRVRDSAVEWSASYERPDADPLAIEEEIAGDLSGAIRKLQP